VALGEFALRHHVVVIVDEIYEKLVYDTNRHVCLAGLAPELRDYVITVKSLSKTYAMTGWRLGYNLASPTLSRAMRQYHQQFSRGSAAFVQQAAITALTGSQDCVAEMVAEYSARRQLVVELVGQIDALNCIVPEGTFFCLLDVRACGLNSEELAQYLVRECGLLSVPGTYYGASLEGHLRLSFAYARTDIVAGLQLLAQGWRQLGQ
jgi:aspartate/methionine/tyrosine aminotransferase